MISLPCSWFPRGYLPRQDLCKVAQVADYSFIQRLIEREQPGLMSQQLPDGNSFFSILSKLRPVFAHEFVVIQPASRMGHCQSHS
jgi:hypothetical protein